MRTVSEWSLEFDLLYNNITSNKAPGLTEYEKSVFLTRGQETVVVGLYKGSFGDAFESTEELTAYLGSLVKQADCSQVAAGYDVSAQKLSPDSVIYANPSDLLFRTWEGCTITVDGCGSMQANVVPVTQDEFWRTSRDPFKKQNKSRVLRLSFATNSDTPTVYGQDIYSELLSGYPITKYTVRYLSRPEPIILQALTGGLSINGQTAAKTCKLDEALHQAILAEAVRMAKAVWNT